jgi:hypothetical protein
MTNTTFAVGGDIEVRRLGFGPCGSSDQASGGRPATGRPRKFPARNERRVRAAIQPTSTGLELAPVLRGFTRRFLAYTFPSRLPDPRHPVVLTRPVVVGAAPALPGASRIRLPPASARPLRRPGDGGLSPPYGHTGASWRTYSNRHGRSPSFGEFGSS